MPAKSKSFHFTIRQTSYDYDDLAKIDPLFEEIDNDPITPGELDRYTGSNTRYAWLTNLDAGSF